MIDDTLDIFDAFCGAGGSSEGARQALRELGLPYRLGVLDHWDTAIATHKANHPDARHYQANVYRSKFREMVPSGRLDLLIASPTCTFFSRSRGGKPISWDQRWGRMTPTQVIRFVNEIDVRRLLVENVPEIRQWCPVHRGPKVDGDGNELEPAPPIRSTLCLAWSKRHPKKACSPGYPCQRLKGSYFRAFLRRLTKAGFRYDTKILKSADFGDPTTRERWFLLGTREADEPIVWPDPTHDEHGGDMFGALPRWRSARECIDPTIRGESIFTRKKRLSQKTLERIYAGCVRYGWPRPFLLKLRAYIDRKPLPTFTAEDLAPHVAFGPLVVRTDMHKSHALCVRSADEPIATVTTGGGFGVVEPFVDVARANAHGSGLDEPLRTVCAAGGHHALVEPFVFQANQGHDRKRNMRSVDEPLPTVVTRTFLGLAQPLVLPQGGGGQARAVDEPVPTIATAGAVALIVPYYGTAVAKTVDEPLPTVTAAHRGELAFIASAFGERQGQAPRTHSVDAPVPTVCAGGSVRLVPVEVDILYRMLEWHELALATSFPPGYVFVAAKKEDLTRQIGNAVTVRLARALVWTIFSRMRRRRAA